MKKLETPQGCISYDTCGSGPPLVMLRGLGRSVRHWLGYEAVLARDFQVITVDHRGVGDSTLACHWTLSIFDLARDVLKVLDHLGVESTHTLGVSLGGMVALAMGLMMPERSRSLVVVNTSIAGQKALRMSPEAALTLGLARIKGDSVFHARLVDLLVGPDCSVERRAEIAQQFEDIASLEGLYTEVVFKQLAAAARFRVARRLRSLAVPTLVLYSTHDRFVPNDNSKKLVQYIPGAKLLPLERAGHEPSLDKGEEFAREVRTWLQEREGESAAAPQPSRSKTVAIHPHA